jgi:ABC-type dipeptide/oligopeptide/nickel transport system permease subunit
MLLFGLSDAAQTTIIFLAIWVVVFPAFVTGLIVFAFVMSRGEAADNEENRRYPHFDDV